ncbi:MAG: hypothetical protein V4618_06750 [Pseudomonadota bacterium]
MTDPDGDINRGGTVAMPMPPAPLSAALTESVFRLNCIGALKEVSSGHRSRPHRQIVLMQIRTRTGRCSHRGPDVDGSSTEIPSPPDRQLTQ